MSCQSGRYAAPSHVQRCDNCILASTVVVVKTTFLKRPPKGPRSECRSLVVSLLLKLDYQKSISEVFGGLQSKLSSFSGQALTSVVTSDRSKGERDNAEDDERAGCPSCQVIYSQFGLAIHQNDHQARRRFVEWAQNEIAVVPDFHKRILFSDEAHVWLNGYVNKQNCRIWREANPQVYVETPLHPEKLTIWCALWAGGIIGPYFFKND
ncbi:transposase [Trichonephila clavipes]|nr:transposase [Trichonephila clavipes]